MTEAVSSFLGRGERWVAFSPSIALFVAFFTHVQPSSTLPQVPAGDSVHSIHDDLDLSIPEDILLDENERAGSRCVPSKLAFPLPGVF